MATLVNPQPRWELTALLPGYKGVPSPQEMPMITPGMPGYRRMLTNDRGRASSPVSDHPAR
jgi:hypothetical protein